MTDTDCPARFKPTAFACTICDEEMGKANCLKENASGLFFWCGFGHGLQERAWAHEGARYEVVDRHGNIVKE